MEKKEIINALNMYSFASFDFLRKFQGPIKTIRPKDIFILVYIYRSNDQHQVTISELANVLHVTPAAISQSINNYEKQGWVTRVRSTTDRRTVFVRITEKTSKVLEDSWAETQNKLSDYLDFIGVEDANNLMGIVSKTADYFNMEIDENTKKIFGVTD